MFKRFPSLVRLSNDNNLEPDERNPNTTDQSRLLESTDHDVSECVVVVAEASSNDEDLQSVQAITMVQTAPEVEVTAQAVETTHNIDEQQPNEDAIKTCLQQIVADGWGCSEKIYYPPPQVSVLNDKDLMTIIITAKQLGIRLKACYTQRLMITD